ncbi:putative flavin-containing monooxygenase 1 [Quercus suber]|uniref:Flavin-containing monooxygenase n=1 Tax=Quercus suber TaxID=58331 RepID=A0AAW0LDC6_QUESU
MAPVFSKIGIIGAGVSGLAAAKQLAHHNPLVFEASDSIGGVWRHCSYSSTKLQSLRCDYEFSDFPWPDRDSTSFPSYTEILEYLTSYANHFDVLKFVRFNSKVVEIRFVGDREATDLTGKPGDYPTILPGHPVWEVAVQTNHSDTIEWYAFEFIVVCIGKYGDVPKIPEFPRNKGPEIFQARSCIPLITANFKRKRLHNYLREEGPEGQPCTMVVRTLHWTVPHYWIWGLPFYMFYSTRSSQFLHEKPNQSFLKTLLCLLLSPMRRGASKFIESYLLWKLPLQKYGLKPDHPFEEDYASCQMAIMPENFFSEADKGKILFKRASNWWFSKEGIEFDDDTKLEADVVVLATGYDGKKKLKAILPEPFRTLLEYPSVPNIAFVGYLESVSNLHTSELRSIWLARLVDEKFKLPSVENMIEQTTKEMAVTKKTTRFYKRHCISTFSINHSDEICEEMGWNSWRKKNWISEAFSPYGSQDYI